MARGNGIIAQAEPKGTYKECVVSGTPKPGTLMQIKAATADVQGTWTYEVLNPSADTDPRAVCVLLCSIDHAACPPHKDATTAYADGERGAVYYPLPGEDMNMLVKDVSGTGDDHAIGDRFVGEHGSGKLLVQATSANRASFQCLEVATDPVADALLLCRMN